jgi:uncharacterized integral membrane protein
MRVFIRQKLLSFDSNKLNTKKLKNSKITVQFFCLMSIIILLHFLLYNFFLNIFIVSVYYFISMAANPAIVHFLNLIIVSQLNAYEI